MLVILSGKKQRLTTALCVFFVTFRRDSNGSRFYAVLLYGAPAGGALEWKLKLNERIKTMTFCMRWERDAPNRPEEAGLLGGSELASGLAERGRASWWRRGDAARQGILVDGRYDGAIRKDEFDFHDGVEGVPESLNITIQTTNQEINHDNHLPEQPVQSSQTKDSAQRAGSTSIGSVEEADSSYQPADSSLDQCVGVKPRV